MQESVRASGAGGGVRTPSSAQEVAVLRGHLERVGYTADGVLARIGEDGQEGLLRNVTVPALHALGEARDELAAAIRLFCLGQDVPADQVSFLEPVADVFLAPGAAPGHVKAAVDLRPYGSPDDGASGWVVSDVMPSLDFVTAPTHPSYVLGVSPASSTLAQMVMRAPVGSALDLGTGCGVQSLHLARHAGHVVATDLNPRAVTLASWSAALSGAEIEFACGDLFAPVAGRRFDLIVSNPPFVLSPPSSEEDTLTYRETNFRGDGLLATILADAPRHLAPSGSIQLLTNWAIVDGQPWEERLAGFAQGTGLDFFAIERERLDVYSYIEMWLADAGLAGTAGWRPAYERWLRYFADLGIVGVGMGWICATAAGRATPHVRIESWPHAVQQPVGEVFARHRAAVDAALVPDDVLLASRPSLVDVREETMGQPGAADPEYLVLRQSRGLLRAMQVDTAFGAVLGALDGELSVGQVIAAVADLLDEDPADLRTRLLPPLRTALEEQYLRPEEG